MEADSHHSFLQKQHNHTTHRIDRLKSAIQNCTECLEVEGLRQMLRTLEIEQGVLDILETQIAARPGLSLEGAILQERKGCQQAITQAATGWKHGQSTPDGYWRTEIQYDCLSRLLSEFHAWRANRPVHALPPVAEPEVPPGFPWYEDHLQPNNNHKTKDLARLSNALHTALENARIPAGMLDLILESPTCVIVTGTVHSQEEHDAVIALIMGIDGVAEVMADIRIVPQSLALRIATATHHEA